MARQREISFFLDIQSDEVFEEFLAQNKLLGMFYHIKNLQVKNKFMFTFSVRCLSGFLWPMLGSS